MAALPAGVLAHAAPAHAAPAQPAPTQAAPGQAAPDQTAPAGQPATLPAGTPLVVKIDAPLPMRASVAISAHTLYPIFVHNLMVLPAGTSVTGKVVDLTPSRSDRLEGRLGGDFTPYDKPVVRFTSIVLANGVVVPISTGAAADGAPLYKVGATPQVGGGLIGQEYSLLKQRAYDSLDSITAPGKADRIRQFVYHQLPYHPQRIAAGTAWTVETAAPVTFTVAPFAPPPPAPPPPPPPHRGRFAALVGRPPAALPASAPSQGSTHAWILNAYLAQSMSSSTSTAGETIHATVAQPVFNPDGSIAVPQGSVLSGTVTQVRRARSFSRAPRLRFSFTSLALPGGEPRQVRATLTGVDSNSADQLAMNREGVVQQKPQEKLAIPVLLFALASRPLDSDHGRDRLQKNAVASNSLGLIGFIIGTGAQQANIASGIGYYGTALSIYQRLIRRSPEISFVRDTRVILETTPTSLTPIKPARH